MMPDSVTTVHVLSGAIVAAYLVAGLFFLRYWHDSRDRLFLTFAAAFGLLGLQRVALVAYGSASEEAIWLYVVRLAAFALILWAIVDKNRAAARR